MRQDPFPYFYIELKSADKQLRSIIVTLRYCERQKKRFIHDGSVQSLKLNKSAMLESRRTYVPGQTCKLQRLVAKNFPRHVFGFGGIPVQVRRRIFLPLPQETLHLDHCDQGNILPA